MHTIKMYFRRLTSKETDVKCNIRTQLTKTSNFQQVHRANLDSESSTYADNVKLTPTKRKTTNFVDIIDC